MERGIARERKTILIRNHIGGRSFDMKTGRTTNGKTRRHKSRATARLRDNPFQCGYLRATRILRIATPRRKGYYSIAQALGRFEDKM
jgi:hypothetical protein